MTCSMFGRAASPRRCLCLAGLILAALFVVVNMPKGGISTLTAASSRWGGRQSEVLERSSRSPAAVTQRVIRHDGLTVRMAGPTLLVDTPGCRIPDIEAYSSEVAPFVMDYEMGACDDPPPLVRSTDTGLFVDRDALAANLVVSPDQLSCCFTAMWRARPDVSPEDVKQNARLAGPLYDRVSHGNDIRFGNVCVPFFEHKVVPYEFVRVNCTIAASDAFPTLGVRRLTDYHAFVPPKRQRGFRDSDPPSPRELVTDESLSVLVLGVDSVSRLNMMRKMPLTRAFLDKLGAVEMLGYNKVEDNTFPNLVPMLSGLSVPELRKECWNDGHHGNDAHFDACPWVWKRFNQEGYVNMFAEDTAWMGLFHYLKRGFVHQPTDYDPRPLLYLGEKELGRRLQKNGPVMCIGQRHQLEVLFDYGLKFVRAMHKHQKKFFSIVWGSSMTHDDLNSAGSSDALYEDTLRRVVDSGVLNRTALIFMSDHGLRFGDILGTFQGRLEERLPAMHILLPEWVQSRYRTAMENLRSNRHRLVTVYDLHETMLNFMDLSTLEEARLRPHRGRTEAPRGRSLFTAISGERTCAAAGIPKHYCACQYLDPVPTDAHRVVQVAEFLLSAANEQLQMYPQCAALRLDAVLDARRAIKPMEHEYQLIVRTRPGGALLSAVIQYRIVTGTMHLDGTISRLNQYANQSWCMPDFKLRLLCNCVQPSPTAAPLALA